MVKPAAIQSMSGEATSGVHAGSHGIATMGEEGYRETKIIPTASHVAKVDAPAMPWHPAVVHFPVALLIIAVAIDVTAIITRHPSWHSPAWRLLVAGTLGALAAVITGNASAAAYRHVEGTADLVQQHEDLATLCLLVFVVACIGRLPIALGRSPRWLPYWIALSLVGIGLLIYTSDLGGELVFVHGVGVATPVQLP